MKYILGNTSDSESIKPHCTTGGNIKSESSNNYKGKFNLSQSWG